MKKEYEDKLLADFPLLYSTKGRPSPFSQRGFEIDDGWFTLIYGLSKAIQNHIDYAADKETVKQATAAQVKEKFGTLRFYVDGADDAIYNFITVAEATSSVTCESCGAPGQVYPGGWIKVRCPECNAIKDEQYPKI